MFSLNLIPSPVGDVSWDEVSEEWPLANNAVYDLETFEPQTSLDDLLNCNCSEPWSLTCQCWDFRSETELSPSLDPEIQSIQSSSCDVQSDIVPSHASSNATDDLVVEPILKQKKSRRLSKDAVAVLRSWLYRHQKYPYPSPEEKERLQQETGLSRAQISYWFSNARRRKLTRTAAVPETNPVDISQQSPLERWKNSPPQSEPAATTDIIRALEAMPCDDIYASPSLAYQRTWSSDSSSASFIVGAPSMSTFEHSQSSGSDISGHNFNQPFQRPQTPMPSHRPRRRRRKPPRLGARKTEKPHPYQCTFCTDSFRTKHDWARHEKTLHLPIDRWPCAPNGGIAVSVDGVEVCVFCHTLNPDEDHLNKEHDYLTCRERPREQRTFDRKDHLRQHLKLSHGVDYDVSMDAWFESRASTVSSRCGFCDAMFTCWTDRMDHIAEHFKTGADMLQWKGGWGFNPEAQKMLKNAMLPYLLGLERRSMDPWKSTALGRSISHQNQVNDIGQALPSKDVPNAYNRYTGLQEQLVAYMRGELARGVHPSDQMLQQKARQISYGDDDPWNQTYADYNPMWLDMVKQEALMGTAQSWDVP
ncbi:uncharacterized protein BDV17DRAFT_278274 [Aspergillus undulatus]|uniref:uncharacterized protein n=1 Tax=Aspergillus undulatus TaxID=1810928 RepID=UPI003CCE1952